MTPYRKDRDRSRMFSPPSKKSVSAMAMEISCWTCGARAYEVCTVRGGHKTTVHAARVDDSIRPGPRAR
jgi:hypothetical protein